MKKPLLAITVIAALAPTVGFTQLISEPDEQPTVCPDRPAEPEIISNMDFRDADKVILLKRMYGAASLQTIIDTGSCSCETPFPEWDQVVEYFFGTLRGPRR